MNIALLLLTLSISTTPDLQDVLDDMRDAQQIPGVSAVVIRNHKVVFAGASGVADLETSRPMTADTSLYIGSVSKVFTAVLALQLVESGQLTLDDEVGGIALGDTSGVRVSHLLTHASGLEREGNFGYWFSGEFPDSDSLSKYLAGAQLRASPGNELHYSNVGYAALGQVIERSLEQSYSAALHQRILEPLNMGASGAPGPADGIANGYSPPGHLLPNAERPFAGIGRRVGDRYVRMYHDARAMSPAFGVYASARDLGRFAGFLLGDGGDSVLSQEMRAQMHARQKSGWGLGLKIRRHLGRTIARHDGWFAAHRAHLFLNAGDGIGIVVLANSDSATPGRIAEALHAALLTQTPP